MKSIRTSLIAAALIALVSAAGCGEKHEDEHAKGKEAREHKDEGVIKLSDAEASRAGIRTEALEEQEVTETVELTATVEPNRERIAHVAPRLPGRIVAVGARLGDAVKQGQALATLESIEVGEAYSAYAQAASEARVAKTAFERAERLHAEQIIPGKEYQRAQGEYEKARVQAQTAAEKLKMLGISTSDAAKGAPVSRFPVTSPLTGTVIEREAVLGELAKPEESLFVAFHITTPRLSM
jgi:cobalt-zinc-cadmium efflux system membrane fusion protein